MLFSLDYTERYKLRYKLFQVHEVCNIRQLLMQLPIPWLYHFQCFLKILIAIQRLLWTLNSQIITFVIVLISFCIQLKSRQVLSSFFPTEIFFIFFYNKQGTIREESNVLKKTQLVTLYHSETHFLKYSFSALKKTWSYHVQFITTEIIKRWTENQLL